VLSIVRGVRSYNLTDHQELTSIHTLIVNAHVVFVLRKHNSGNALALRKFANSNPACVVQDEDIHTFHTNALGTFKNIP
jgi:Tfp pilus tip-associated adhesin PilY1